MVVFENLQCGKPLVVGFRLRKLDHCYCPGVLEPLVCSFAEVFGMFERVLSFHRRVIRHQATQISSFET